MIILKIIITPSYIGCNTNGQECKKSLALQCLNSPIKANVGVRSGRCTKAPASGPLSVKAPFWSGNAPSPYSPRRSGPSTLSPHPQPRTRVTPSTLSHSHAIPQPRYPPATSGPVAKSKHDFPHENDDEATAALAPKNWG